MYGIFLGMSDNFRIAWQFYELNILINQYVNIVKYILFWGMCDNWMLFVGVCKVQHIELSGAKHCFPAESLRT